MSTAIALPLLGLLLILQSSLVSRVPLLHGTADLVLLALLAWALQKRVQTTWRWVIIGGLLVNLVSALPLGVPLAGYGLAAGLALLLRKRVWQAPILAMYLATFAGTMLTQVIAYLALRILGSPIPVLEAFNQVFLPSVLLNLLLALPMYALIGDLASWLYPEEIQV